MERDRPTCWTMIRAASGGATPERDRFGDLYLPIVRSYLGARWRGTHHIAHIEDAVQEAFVDCFRDNGALSRLDPDRGIRFRTFLFAVVRNVALRFEERAARDWSRRRGGEFRGSEFPADEDRLSRIFDRAWARRIVQRAAVRQAAWAREEGAEAVRRVEILRHRFQDNMPVRIIAEAWGEDPAIVHRQYARARREFKRFLLLEMSSIHPGTQKEVESECAELLELLR